MKRREKNAPERALRAFNIENLFTQCENRKKYIPKYLVVFLESLERWYGVNENLTDRQYAALKKIANANKGIT